MSPRAPHTTILLAAAIALASTGCATAHEEDASATKAKTKKVDLTRLPLGDGRTTTSGPKRGYIYSCQAYTGQGGGAGTDGPWIGSKTFDYTKKAIVDGQITWPSAKVSFKGSGSE